MKGGVRTGRVPASEAAAEIPPRGVAGEDGSGEGGRAGGRLGCWTD